MSNKNLSINTFTKETLPIKESALSATIKEYLDVHRIYNDRLNSGKVEIVKKYFCKKTNQWKEFRNWLHLCAEGTPDRFCIIEGFTIFIEVKQRGKKPTPEQLAKHDELRTKAKAFVIVVNSFEDFVKQFNDIKRTIEVTKVLRDSQKIVISGIDDFPIATAESEELAKKIVGLLTKDAAEN